MKEIDWTALDEKQLETWQARVGLVETLLDESIEEAERAEIRRAWIREHGVSERTIRNYLRRYRQGGPQALLFHRSRASEPSPRVHDATLRQRILALLEENPRRTVPQLRRLLSRHPAYAEAVQQVSDRSLYRFLAEQGLTQRQRAAKALEPGRRSFRQFQACSSMELVQGDARDGIWLPDPLDPSKSRKTYLFGWIDDYSRRVLFARYYWDEKLPRMEDSFRTMVLRWGIPKKLYLDNAHIYLAGHFAFILSKLGVRKIHHRAYQSWCKGKIESLMKTLKNEFQSEAQRAGFQTLEELNSALWAWIDVEYNRRNHSSTGEPPQARFASGLPQGHRRIEDLAWFEALFLLPARRTVTKYGIIKLHANQYRTSAPYGSVIEIRYNPFDLSTVWRFEADACVETLSPHTITNTTSPAVSEEPESRQTNVSQAAAAWFTELRSRQAQLRAQAEAPRYSKLSREDDA
jgi:putative transposase